MPRELAPIAKEDNLQGAPQITKSPEEVEETGGVEGATGLRFSMGMGSEEDEEAMIAALSQRNEKRDQLHPYTQTLKLSDVDSCVLLEAETFPPHERCTREKFEYRLKRCGELSLGIFTSHDANDIVTAETSAPVYSGTPERKAVLLGHIVATKTTNPTVTDDDMNIPDPDSTGTPDPKVGHKEEGRTICIHSLAILPQYQRRGLGKTLMKAYIQRMESQSVADRAALIAHEGLIPYYEALGFINLGPSEAQFGGGGWFDMVRELAGEDEEIHVEVEDVEE